MNDTKSANGWTRLGAIRSESNPSKQYVVALRNPSEKHPKGYLGCDCPSAKFRKGTKPHDGFEHTCKHMRALLDGLVRLIDFDATPFGIAWYQARLMAKVSKAA
jgi:hypothetical protein